MGFCSLQRKEIRKLIGDKALTSHGYILDHNKIVEANENLSNEFKKYYGVRTKNALGEIKNSKIVFNTKAYKLEENHNKNAEARYGKTIKYGDWFTIEGENLLLTPKSVTDLYKFGPKKSYVNKVVNNKVVNIPISEIIGLDDKLDYLIDDINRGEKATISGSFQSITQDIVDAELLGDKAVEKFKTEAKEIGYKNYLEDLLSKMDPNSPYSIINNSLNEALKGQNYDIELFSNLEYGGEARYATILLNVWGLGVWEEGRDASVSIMRTYLHEKVHLVSNILMDKPGYRKKMQELYDIVKKNSDFKDYGMEDVYEFVSEGLTNPNFQEKLASIPYKKTTFFGRFIDNLVEAVEDFLGVNIQDSVLEELITYNVASIKTVNSDFRINRLDRDKDFEIFTDINKGGKYEGYRSLEELYRWAKQYGLSIGDNKQIMLRSSLGVPVNLTKANIDYHINYGHSQAVTEDLYKNETMVSLVDDAVERSKTSSIKTPTLNSKFTDKNNIEGDIEALKEFTKSIIPPADQPDGKYQIGLKEYYRTTAFLGFKGDDTKQILKDASRIGNVVDELSKRVFRGDGLDNITYKDVNKLVKKELWKRELLANNKLDKEKWEKKYLNPVSESAFDLLKSELSVEKATLEDEYNIKKFHVDIIGWNDSLNIAGEIDILAEHEDGSFRVIDMKTRKGGVVKYGGAQGLRWNDKTKHTMQTNTYSSFLHDMGFKMRQPLIIMAKPDYEVEEGVDASDVGFVEIDEDRLITTIRNLDEYDYTQDLEAQLFNYTKVNSKVKKNSKAGRLDYIDWNRRQTSTREKANRSKFAANKSHKEKLKTKLSTLAKSVKEYMQILDKEVAEKTDFHKILKLFEIKLEAELEKELDDVALADQVVLAESFLAFTAKRLEELVDSIDSFPANDVEELREEYARIKRYKEIEVISRELFNSISSIYYNAETDPAYIELKDKYDKFVTVNANLETLLRGAMRSIFTKTMLDQYLGSKAEIVDDKQVIRELEDKYRGLSNPRAKKEAIDADLLNYKSTDEYRAKLMEKYSKEIDEMMDSVHIDLKTSTFMINADPSVNNKFVMLMHSMIGNHEQEYTNLSNDKLIRLSKLQLKLGLSKAESNQLLEIGKNGQYYLKGDYSIKFFDKILEWRDKINKAEQAVSEAENRDKTAARKKLRAVKRAKRIWEKQNTEATEDYGSIPIAKWKNNLKGLNERQLEALNAFKEITTNSSEDMNGQRSLIRTTFVGDVEYFKLPGVLKTPYALVTEGNLDEFRKKIWRSAATIEKDDTEEGATQFDDSNRPIITSTGLDGREIYSVPVFFRNDVKGLQQNTDLFTVYAMELENGIRYKVFNDLTKKTSIFMDLIEDLKFFKTKGIAGQKITSQRLVPGEEDTRTFATIDGIASTVHRSLTKMLENRVYSMTREYAGPLVGSIDAQRAMDLVGAYSAYASMSFKVLSATNNFITGKVGNIVESVGGEFYTTKEWMSAQAFYWKGNNIGATIADMGRPVKRGLVNQLMNMFDAGDGSLLLKNQFERQNAITRLARPEVSFSLYSMGEHEINGTVMLAVLEGTKVTNKEGKYITKKGKVTSKRSEAASLLDAYELDSDEIIKRKAWAKFTEFDTVNQMDKGGTASIRLLVKDRIFRTQGAYDTKMQGQINRLWWGRLFSQFRKHMPPQMLNRFRGVNNAHKSTAEISDDKKYFNIQAKTEEYGYYTSFLRFIINVIKQEKVNIINYSEVGAQEWKDMSRHERANINKTVFELSYITSTILLGMLAYAAAMEYEDELTWTIAYLLRRQRADSGLQYYDPQENWRLLESPMAALRVLDNAGSALRQLFSPGEIYAGGKNNGKSKLLIKMRRAALLDRLDQFDEGYSKSMYNLFNR